MANVLFDFDGTLFDTYPGIARCLNLAFSKLSLPLLDESVLRKFLGPPLYASMRDYAHLSGELCEEAVRLFREEYAVRGLYESRPYDGIEQLLKELKESGVDVCVASSKPIQHIQSLLNRHGLTDYFTRIVGADMKENHDDKTGLLLKAMTEKSAVMVGDRRFDMQAAKALSLRAVGVTYGFGDESELLTFGADYLAADVGQLKKLLFEIL